MSACKTLEFTSSSLSFERASVKVEILPRDPNREPRVSWNVGGRSLYRTDHLKLFDSLDFEVRRTTIYRGESAALATPEHLAPVFLLWPDVSFDVNVDGVDVANPVPEIPLMDGSALPFFLALRREAGVPRELSFYDAAVSRQWDLRNVPDQPSYGHVRIEPAGVSSPVQPFRCMVPKTFTACFRPGLLSWKGNMNRPAGQAFWPVLRKVAVFLSNPLRTSPFIAFPKSPPCTKF